MNQNIVFRLITLNKGRWRRKFSVNIDKNKRIAVAMSGGIDSSAALAKLLSEGFSCIGVFMKNWDSNDEEGKETCPEDQDWEDVQKICKALGVPSFQTNFTKEYWNNVFAPFLESHQTGYETPNPDVLCNRFVKFYHFKKYIKEKFGIELMATGHYAQIKSVDNIQKSISQDQDQELRHSICLAKGVDPKKDQSYFLSMIHPSDLDNVLFPLGGLRKNEVRAFVQSHPILSQTGLLERKESMGICFIGKRKLPEFLGQYIQLTPGRFVDIDSGEVVGRHSAKETLTIGQKARIGGVSAKYFVVGKSSTDTEHQGHHELINRTRRIISLRSVQESEQDRVGDVYVTTDPQHPGLYTTHIHLSYDKINWIHPSFPSFLLGGSNESPLFHGSKNTKTTIDCQFKVRYSQSPEPCSIEAMVINDKTVLGSRWGRVLQQNKASPGTKGAENPVNYILKVTFQRPQRAVTPGQIITFYHNDLCLGGAIVD